MNDLRTPDLHYMVAQIDHYERIEAAELARSLREEAPRRTFPLLARLFGAKNEENDDNLSAN